MNMDKAHANKGSIEERVQRQIQAQLAAAHQRKLARQELQQAAPDLTPIADRLARKRYNRSIDEMARASASDANLHNTVQALYREAALEYTRLQRAAGDE